MLRFIRISRAFWNRIYPFVVLMLLVGASGCVSRAPSLRMLDTRAGYNDNPDDEEVALYQKGKHAQDTVLKRSGPRVAKVYIFPHELPTKDYFWGAYVSLLIEQDQWVFEQQDEGAPPIAGIREAKGRRKHKPAKATTPQPPTDETKP